jgi:hypothetical protein
MDQSIRGPVVPLRSSQFRAARVRGQKKISLRRHRNLRLNCKLRSHLDIDFIYTGHRERRHDRIGDSIPNLVRLTLNEEFQIVAVRDRSSFLPCPAPMNNGAPMHLIYVGLFF